jgi:hypothetical protein
MYQKKRFERTFNARLAQHPHHPLDQAIKVNSHCQNRRTIIIEYGEYHKQVLDRIRVGRCCTRDSGRVLELRIGALAGLSQMEYFAIIFGLG